MITNKDVPPKVERDAFRIVAELAIDPDSYEALQEFSDAFQALVRAHERLLERAKAQRVKLPAGHYRDPLYYPAAAEAAEHLGFYPGSKHWRGLLSESGIGEEIARITAQNRWPIPRVWHKALKVR